MPHLSRCANRVRILLRRGRLYGSARTYVTASKGQLTDAKAYNDMVIAYQNGAPIHLKEIGYAVHGIQQD
jgi:multidrug efflux pump subunit AcrB